MSTFPHRTIRGEADKLTLSGVSYDGPGMANLSGELCFVIHNEKNLANDFHPVNTILIYFIVSPISAS